MAPGHRVLQFRRLGPCFFQFFGPATHCKCILQGRSNPKRSRKAQSNREETKHFKTREQSSQNTETNYPKLSEIWTKTWRNSSYQRSACDHTRSTIIIMIIRFQMLDAFCKDLDLRLSVFFFLFFLTDYISGMPNSVSFFALTWLHVILLLKAV